MDEDHLRMFLNIVQDGYGHSLLVRYDLALPSPDFTLECELPSLPQQTKVDRVYLFPRNFNRLQGDTGDNLVLGLYATLVSSHDAAKRLFQVAEEWNTMLPSQEEAVERLVRKIYSTRSEQYLSAILQERYPRIEEFLGLESAIGLMAIRDWQVRMWGHLMDSHTPAKRFGGFR